MVDIMRLLKPLHFLLGAVLFCALWLGYWIGHISSTSSSGMPEVVQQEGAIYKVQSQHKASHHFKDKDTMHNRNSKVNKYSQSKIPEALPRKQSVGAIKNIDSIIDERNMIVNRPFASRLPENAIPDLPANYQLRNSPKDVGQIAKEGKDREALIAIIASQNRQTNNIKPAIVPQNTPSKKVVLPAVPQQPPSREHYYLLHGNQAVKIHGRIHENIRTFPDYIPKNHYIFTSKSLPKDSRFRPSVANGHIGTAIHSKAIFMNGLYCGADKQSHRAEIPSTCSLNITEAYPPQNFSRDYSLNVGEGMYTETLQTPTYTVTHRIYAHRTLNRLMVVEVDLERNDLRVPKKLKVSLNKWHISPDLTFLNKHSNISEVSYKMGTSNAAERRGIEKPNEVHVLYDHVPNELIPPRTAYRTKWVFLSAIAPTMVEAYAAYYQGSRLAKSNDKLYADHVEGWAHLWGNGSIGITGNDKLAKAVYGSLYYILSSLPVQEDKTWPFVGLSPAGLPFGEFELDYQGHVFWDQETWMFPPILMLYPNLGKIILQTRNRTRSVAQENAKVHRFKGLQYPWESAYSGIEVSPDVEIGEKEIHITGDISFAIMQYLKATGDTKILEDGFLNILAEIANYWVSRLRYNETLDKFTIMNVIPPDEYQRGVNNSVFTNTIAFLALEAPMKAYRLLGKLSTHWKHFQNIYIPFDDKLQYHPEFDGYKRGTKVKQADAIMLGFPLQTDVNDDVRRNDLTEYAKVTDISGPAMSWAMFAINYLKIGETRKAEEFFKKNFGFIKNEFQVWHETVYGKGATNFITGMGGFLQMIIFGYAGLDLNDDSLKLKPVLPPDCEQLQLMDFEYLGSSFNLFVEKKSYKLVLVRQAVFAPPLKLVIPSEERQVPLRINEAINISPISTTSVEKIPEEEFEEQR